MRVTHVVPHINQEASGPSYSVPRLCQALAECGHEVELKCLAANGPIPGVELSVHRQWSIGSHFAISTDMTRALRREAREVDIIHNHSLWSMVNVATGCVVPGRRAKLVTSPRGTLSPWALARSRRIKQLLKPIQWRVLQRADLLHATSEMELADIRGLGLHAPVAVIPNGIDLPPPRPKPEPNGTRTALFLSRIHPKKGIDELLHAWQRIEATHADWRLVIAGTGEPAHIEHVKYLAESLGVRHVEFLGPLYGCDKDAAYANANLFVLPTHSENFGMVVAEALAHGCPAIVTHGAPWQGLEVEDCGWWIHGDVDTLAHTLGDAMERSPNALTEMGVNGREWMTREFSWSGVGDRMDAAYRWLVDGGNPPPYVYN
jgi:glycosyltransferase involved in cell wall biosynthesis